MSGHIPKLEQYCPLQGGLTLCGSLGMVAPRGGQAATAGLRRERRELEVIKPCVCV